MKRKSQRQIFRKFYILQDFVKICPKNYKARLLQGIIYVRNIRIEILG